MTGEAPRTTATATKQPSPTIVTTQLLGAIGSSLSGAFSSRRAQPTGRLIVDSTFTEWLWASSNAGGLVSWVRPSQPQSQIAT